jgi:hypothetical protein
MRFVAQYSTKLANVYPEQFAADGNAGPYVIQQFLFGDKPLRVSGKVQQNLIRLGAQWKELGLAPKLLVGCVKPKGRE